MALPHGSTRYPRARQAQAQLGMERSVIHRIWTGDRLKIPVNRAYANMLCLPSDDHSREAPEEKLMRPISSRQEGLVCRYHLARSPLTSVLVNSLISAEEHGFYSDLVFVESLHINRSSCTY